MIDLTTKAQRVQWVMDELESLYPETPVPLDHTDAYTLLVAVLLSAQCTDARVNTVTPALFELADNPRDMMRQSVEDIRQIIRPCGLSPRNPSMQRAQGLHAIAVSVSLLAAPSHPFHTVQRLFSWQNGRRCCSSLTCRMQPPRLVDQALCLVEPL